MPDFRLLRPRNQKAIFDPISCLINGTLIQPGVQGPQRFIGESMVMVFVAIDGAGAWQRIGLAHTFMALIIVASIAQFRLFSRKEACLQEGGLTVDTSALRPPAQRAASALAGRVRRRHVTVSAAALYTVAVLAALLWLAPLAWAFATSIKPEGETTVMPPTWFTANPTFEAYLNVLGRGDIIRWTVNSLATTTIVTVLTLIVCVSAAYGFSRFDFRGRPWLFALIIGGILIPPQTLIVPQFVLMTQLGLVDTYWGIALPQVVAPVFVFILKRFFDAVPREYEDAAKMDGAGPLRVLWSVLLPLSRPILTAVGIFTFIGAWNNFLWPFLVTTAPEMMTLPVGLDTVMGGYGIQYAQVMASAVLGAIPLLIVFLLFQRHIVTGVAGAGIKG